MRILGRRAGPTSGASKMLRRLLSTYRARVAVLAAASFVGALIEAAFLVLVTGVAVALVAGKTTLGPWLGQSVPIRTALILGAVLLVVRLALNLGTVRLSASLTADVTAEQRQMLANAYLSASWSVHQAEPAGRLQALLMDFVNTATSAVATFTNGIIALLSLVAFLGTGLVVNAPATGAVLIALGVVGAVLVPMRRRIRRVSWASAEARLTVANSVSELGALGLEMATFGVRRQFAQRIEVLNRDATGTQRRVQTLTGSLAPLYIALAYAALLTGVGVLTIVGAENLAVIGAVILLMLRSLSYGQQLASAAGALAASAPYLDHIHQTVERYTGSPAPTGTRVPPSVTPLEAQNVSFAYRPDRSALSGLTFGIEHGEVVGVIGPSGAGKSTLAQLILGLLEPNDGVMRVAGVNLADVDRDWWSCRIAFVAQDASLFTGTVAENIRFFRDDISDEAIERAARQANVLTEIQALPQGFDTHLGERGGQLSGGQRQRLSIARALAGGPELLVLDEPTSALDGHSEALIRGTVANLKGEVTVVVIAHRMSTLDICDRIMVLEHGELSAFGSPDMLRRDSDFYQRAMAVAGISDVAET